MSLSQVQDALAMLIRLPEENRGEDTKAFLDGFEFTPLEREQLESLALDPSVTKYGRSMANVRWENVDRDLTMVRSVVPESLIQQLRYQHFEPSAVRMRMGDFSKAFLEFVLSDEKARSLIEQECPAFALDLFRMELAQTKFKRKLRDAKPAPEGSMLAHTAFELVDLEYDVLGFLNGDEKPLKRRIKVLIVPAVSGKGFRYFEVGADVQDFLLSRLNSTTVRGQIPKNYADLVGIGLCRAIN